MLRELQSGESASLAISVFIYGGFFGLGIGAIEFLYNLWKKTNQTKHH
jgi:hypothetical protein